MRAVLGIGSNLGDRAGYLRSAVETLGVAVQAVSPVYETEPVGGPGGQDAYLNLVAVLETDLAPKALLALCHQLEAAAGRVREERWGPRTLDVDILWIDGVELRTSELEVPHPRLRQRRFVLAPLGDVAPDLVDETWWEGAVGDVQRCGQLDELL